MESRSSSEEVILTQHQFSRDQRASRVAAYRLLEGITRRGGSSGGEETPETAMAMPLVLNLPKSNLPARLDIMAAAATAVAQLSLSPDAGDNPLWREHLQAWYGLKIRKVARRARNKAWTDATALPGVVAEVNGAQVMASIPYVIADTPHPVAKLQVSGTDVGKAAVVTGWAGLKEALDSNEGVHHAQGTDSEQSPGEPIAVMEPLIAVDSSLAMSVGKIAAQVGHAAQLYALSVGESAAIAWVEVGCPLRVVEVSGEFFTELAALNSAAVVRDGGYTEVAPGSLTALAVPLADLKPFLGA